jgi:hypothetical protein
MPDCQAAESVAYDPIILHSVNAKGELRDIEMPESYMRRAGDVARQRIVATGLRLAMLVE